MLLTSWDAVKVVHPAEARSGFSLEGLRNREIARTVIYKDALLTGLGRPPLLVPRMGVRLESQSCSAVPSINSRGGPGSRLMGGCTSIYVQRAAGGTCSSPALPSLIPLDGLRCQAKPSL